MPASSRKYFRDDALLRRIGTNVRRYRLSKNLTQMDLAFACNDCDYSQINRVELGKVNFSISFLGMLAKALDLPIEQLLLEDE